MSIDSTLPVEPDGDRSDPIPLRPLTRIAVVGGGALGLAALEQLIEGGVPREAIVCFEGRSDVGGLWKFEEDPGDLEVVFSPEGQPVARTSRERDDRFAIPPSALYKNLKVNLPAQDVMAFRGNPFKESNEIFPGHAHIQEYLVHFADSKNLRPLIRFNSTVTRLRHSGESGWLIDSRSEGEERSETFSHVILANGHYSSPYIPNFAGLWFFRGEIIHSRWWRDPEPLRGKRVLVVGSRASGGDIARDLALLNLEDVPTSSPPTHVFQSTRADPSTVYPEPTEPWEREIEVVAQINEITPEGAVLLSDGRTLSNLDAIVFATGYNFSYPFCRPTDEPWVSYPLTRPRHSFETAPKVPPPKDSTKIDRSLPLEGGSQVDNLDRSQIFYAPDPTLSLIGLAYMVVPFILGQTQSRLITRAYTSCLIPSLPPLKTEFPPPSGEGGGNRHFVGFPAEADNCDDWIEAIGEGSSGTGWALTGERFKEGRKGAKALRRKLLGY